MSPSGPTGLNLLAVGYALDNLYESVDNKRYFIDKLSVLVDSILKSMQESAEKKHGNT